MSFKIPCKSEIDLVVAWFSRAATSSAALSLVTLNTNVSSPVAALFFAAFAWIDTNISAFNLFAIAVLSSSGMKISLSLVKWIFKSGSAFKYS